MFAPMFYEELVLCGDEGRLKATENEDFLPVATLRADTHLEILCGDRKPTRIGAPCYPTFIQQSGHHGATYFEHVSFVDNMESRHFEIAGEAPSAATALEGFWSIVVGVAAETSVKAGKPVLIDELLQENGIEI
jgi:hypothetical protein